jgi:hypothetical protein
MLGIAMSNTQYGIPMLGCEMGNRGVVDSVFDVMKVVVDRAMRSQQSTLQMQSTHQTSFVTVFIGCGHRS